MNETKRFEKFVLQRERQSGRFAPNCDKISTPEKNLIDNSFVTEWCEAKNELKSGAGRELDRHFLSYRSSSALVVNNFLSWKRAEFLRNIFFQGQSNFCNTWFEKRQRTGLGGTPPHIDFFLENATHVFAFESKFLEPLKETKKEDGRYFAESYCKHSLPEEMRLIMQQYEEGKDGLFFNAPQLIKHAIGLINQNQKNSQPKKITLIYLYWVPTNHMEYIAEASHPYSVHQAEMDEFVKRIANIRDIDFVSMTYLELWAMFDKMFVGNEKLQEYYRKVKERYEFAVPLSIESE